MNSINKKLKELEKNVIPDFPKEGSSRIAFENGSLEEDSAEHALHDRATRILQNHQQRRDEIEDALKQGKTPEQLPELSPDEKAIVSKSERLMFHRIMEIFDA